MLQTITRTLPRITVWPVMAQRAMQTSSVALKDAMKSPKPLSEGHSTFDKSKSKLAHDPQSASAAEGQEAKDKGTSSAEPFDAAVMGHGTQGGKLTEDMKKEKADNTGNSGAFADQIGGQPTSDDATSAKGEEGAAGQSTGAIGLGKKLVNKGFDGLKQMREDKRNFSTSARAWKDKTPKETGKEEKKLQGEQNEHLKHKSASEKDQGKGNAAPTPSLPSKKAEGKRSLHTSAIARVEKTYVKAVETEPVNAGYSAPEGGHLPESGYRKLPSAPSNLKASSDIIYSSSAVDPPNKVLAEQAKAGTLADVNPPPSAEVGEMGKDEAWKHRK